MNQAIEKATQLHQAGIAALQAGKLDLAAEHITGALELDPKNTDFWSNLGNVLRMHGRTEESISAFETAIALDPKRGEIWSNFGNTLRDAGRLDDAIAAFRRGVEVSPKLAEGFNNLGVALEQKGEKEEAARNFEHAIALRPEYAEPLVNLGSIYEEFQQISPAMECYKRAVAANPRLAQPHNNLGNILKTMGDIDGALHCYRRALELNPSDTGAAANFVYTLHFHPEVTPEKLRDEQKRFDELYCKPLMPGTSTAPRHHSSRKTRVGYISADFRQHILAFNFLPIIEKHDRSNFEIYCYSNVLHPDATTEQIQSLADQWRNIARVDDAKAEQMIRADEVDVLIDLSLHSAGNRLQLFARRPAPVQISYLGYCGAAGIEAIDGHISDPYIDDATTETDYRERTLYLPSCYWCYRPAGAAPEPVWTEHDGMTFGSLNNFAKLSPPAMKIWLSILDRVPQSRLLIHSPPGAHRDGLNDPRIEFVPRQSWENYISTYSRIDIALDPFPFNGGITTCDALWMGTPVVALEGRTSVGRAGKSILSNIGLGELIAKSPEDYVQIAVELANNQSKRRELRSTLRRRMLNSPLMDAAGLAKALEDIYRREMGS